jgi:hypothetical protein
MEGRRVKFTGTVAFHENGTMYRQRPEGQPQYVGQPSEDIDNAWKRLLHGSVIDLPASEPGRIKDQTWHELQGDMWRTG